MARKNNRLNNEMRPLEIEVGVNKHAEGSALIKFGDTHVICTASIENHVPRWMRGSNEGWITAEYGMLPRSTHERMNREAARGKQTGRTMEIQRLIGRSLRQAVDLKYLKDKTINIDCDVIQADGGTRTASISGACIALFEAIKNFAAKCGSFGGKNFGCLLIVRPSLFEILVSSTSLYFCLAGCLLGTGNPPVFGKISPTKSSGFSITSKLYLLTIFVNLSAPR